MTNKDLAKIVDDAIEESGYKKVWIAKQLGITSQSLNKLMTKQNFTLNDANKILDIIGYDAKIIIRKRI